ncbi:MAG: hypothetical protein AABZ57_07970 [Candidatus Margulisiibacteriota bacterium]
MAVIIRDSITVPVIHREKLVLPRWMSTLRNARWPGVTFFRDIDETVLGSSDVHRHDFLDRRALTETTRLISNDDKREARLHTRLAYVTGADWTLQTRRTVEPFMAHLKRIERPEIALDFALSACRGGIISVFNAEGCELTGIRKEYVKEFGISDEHISELELVLNEVIGSWFRDSGHEDPIRFEARPIPEYFESKAEFMTNRSLAPYDLSQAPDWQLAQIGVKPFPGDTVMQRIVMDIENGLKGTALDGQYSFELGGGTTIDINRRGVNKPSSMRWLLNYWGIECIPIPDFENPLAYGVPIAIGMGDSFTVKARSDGTPSFGGDLGMLELPNLFALPVNYDSLGVERLKSYWGSADSRAKRILHGGAGPEATLEFDIWANRPGENDNSGFVTPMERNTDLSVPPAMTDFLRTAPDDGIIVISGSLLTGFSFGKETRDSSKFDPALLGIAELMRRGVPVVVATGGDYKNRILPIFAALSSAVVTPQMVKIPWRGGENFGTQALFYSNGGTIKTRLKDEELVHDSDFGQQFTIKPDDLKKLGTFLNKLAKRYNSAFSSEHDIE